MSVTIRAVDPRDPPPQRRMPSAPYQTVTRIDGAMIGVTGWEVRTVGSKLITTVTQRHALTTLDIWAGVECQGLKPQLYRNGLPVLHILHITITEGQCPVITNTAGEEITGWADLRLTCDYSGKAGITACLTWKAPNRDAYDDSASFEADYAAWCVERETNRQRLGGIGALAAEMEAAE